MTETPGIGFAVAIFSIFAPNLLKRRSRMILLGEEALSLDVFERIVFHNQRWELSAESMEKVKLSFEFLASFSKDKLIYGINTGFGPMAQYRIEDTDLASLQQNLIRSHSAGMGDRLPPLFCRATLLSRLHTLTLGYSGIHPSLVELMKALLHHQAYPCLYAHGGVGASGDLVQLAHLALGLMGEGEYWWNGEIRPAEEVFRALKLAPLKIQIREGLALLNGTSAMTGIGAINLILSHRLIRWSTLISLAINEIMGAYDDHFSLELNEAKRHPGQQKIARWMREMAQGSQLLRNRQQHLYARKVTDAVLVDRVQEPYSLRCIPQILGPVLETIGHAEDVVVRELHSVNDNPVVDAWNENIFHGGNFHGDYISLEMDKLKMSITKLSMLAERQINFLLNPHLNQKLPPFANAGKLGLNFGIQGMQYPATSTVAENQTLSNPVYVHSIPSNNDNQDMVSMGCNAARLCHQVVDNSFEVLAIACATVAQSIDLLKNPSQLSDTSRWFYQEIRKHLPFFKEDRAQYEALAAIKTWLKDAEVEPLKKIQ